MEGYKTDLYDYKLLYELDRNSAASLSKLANLLKRSKQFVSYRLKKLEESGIITGYHAIVDMSKLGYFTFRLYFKLQQMTESDGRSFVNHVKSNLPQVWTITSMHGKWDYALFIGVKNIQEFHTVWDDIMYKYKENIKSYNVALYAPIYNFNRKIFTEKAKEVVERVYGAGEREDLDKLDNELITLYANNVRQSSLEMGNKLNVSHDTISKRIRILEKKKVIVGYNLGLDLEKLGFTGYRVDLQLKSTKKNKELFQFCKMHKYIYQINKSIGGADFEIEVIVEDRAHLLKILDEIKIEFKEVINDIDYFGFSVFHLLKYIPD